MKFKHILVFISVLSVCVLMFAQTAFAAYLPPFIDIANDEGYTIFKNDDGDYDYVIIQNDKSRCYYLVTTSYKDYFDSVDNPTVRFPDTLYSPTSYIYTISYSNPYTGWTSKKYTYNQSVSLKGSIISSSKNLYANGTDAGNDVSVYSANPLSISNSSSSGSSSGGSTSSGKGHLNFTTSMLNGVLAEIIACLPILIPVIIAFIAIRKGIKFTLCMLRSA